MTRTNSPAQQAPHMFNTALGQVLVLLLGLPPTLVRVPVMVRNAEASVEAAAEKRAMSRRCF